MVNNGELLRNSFIFLKFIFFGNSNLVTMDHRRRKFTYLSVPGAKSIV
jgi:hypothetical protein